MKQLLEKVKLEWKVANEGLTLIYRMQEEIISEFDKWLAVIAINSTGLEKISKLKELSGEIDGIESNKSLINYMKVSKIKYEFNSKKLFWNFKIAEFKPQGWELESKFKHFKSIQNGAERINLAYQTLKIGIEKELLKKHKQLQNAEPRSLHNALLLAVCTGKVEINKLSVSEQDFVGFIISREFLDLDSSGLTVVGQRLPTVTAYTNKSIEVPIDLEFTKNFVEFKIHLD